ncbi:MAG: DUF3450 domain-containing protein [Pseudomonadota bacterium]
MNLFVNGKRRAALAGAAVALCMASAPSVSQSVDSVLRAESSRLNRQVQSQQRIDRIVEQTRSITDQYRAVNKEIDGLNIYNQLLTAQVDRQGQKLAEIETSMQNATVVNRQILPLITRMVAGLEQSISLDMPFLMAERTQRVADLKGIMDDPDVSTAEKFRKAIEAYQIEVDFGRTIESYEDVIEIDGQTIAAKFLRIGRIALLFQNDDGSITGRFDPSTRQPVIDNSLRAEVQKGLAVATKQIAPELLLLPVSGPAGD